MPNGTGELTCVRCGLEVRVDRESGSILERMRYVCFHFEFEHTGSGPGGECDAPDCPSSQGPRGRLRRLKAKEATSGPPC